MVNDVLVLWTIKFKLAEYNKRQLRITPANSCSYILIQYFFRQYFVISIKMVCKSRLVFVFLKVIARGEVSYGVSLKVVNVKIVQNLIFSVFWHLLSFLIGTYRMNESNEWVALEIYDCKEDTASTRSTNIFELIDGWMGWQAGGLAGGVVSITGIKIFK